ncbi:MAG: ribosome-associated heat shock protein Hsp15 [Ruminobacter sp.]|jgi:ribosome-associated heat shock protein Hsp15|nr:ribosome-associated heat shock protein Hsp15 [Ruminobacter sp.]MBR1924943.1 ribosome-associated heat shock protein Hsp15 [Ruminobacter sp.]
MTDTVGIRLDKWLWAARFYKTRSLAKDMIEGGKVHYNGYRTKPGKTVEIGANIELWQGFNKIEIVVKGLSEQRQKASIAQTLYEETPESVARREKQALEHKLQIMFAPHPEQRPDKKQRRKLLTLKHHFE